MSTLETYLHAEARLGSFGARFLTAAGRPFLRRVPAATHGLPPGEPHQCFQNALDLAAAHPELTYCEGRAFGSIPVPVEHAWCVTQDGSVIDTTWPDGPAEYFGAAFTTDFMLVWVLRTQHYGVLANFFPEKLLAEDPHTFLASPPLGSAEATLLLFSEMRDKLQGMRVPKRSAC